MQWWPMPEGPLPTTALKQKTNRTLHDAHEPLQALQVRR
jgi:hypothetical protein